MGGGVISAQTKIEPAQPRANDQIFVTLSSNSAPITVANFKLSFSPRGFIFSTVNFVFPPLPAGFYGTSTTNSVLVDLGGGIWETYPINGGIISHFYISPGYYTLRYHVIGAPESTTKSVSIQAKFNPSVNYADFVPSDTEPWVIEGGEYTPDGGCGAYGSVAPSTATAKGYIHTLYAPGNTSIKKPFIVVEGFDPDPTVVTDPSGKQIRTGSNGWDVLVTGRSEGFIDPSLPAAYAINVYGMMPTFFNGLRSRGYDIIFLDFANGGDYMERNAKILRELIIQVNAKKSASGSREPNVIMGASMGGLIARMVLKQMEDKGEDHCTSLFISFDAPHNGANIPLSIQSAAFFANATGLDPRLWAALNTPAARQLLIENIGASENNNTVDFHDYSNNSPWFEPLNFSTLTGSNFSCLRENSAAAFQSLGFPEKCRKIALVDGAINKPEANNQGFFPGDKIYGANVYINPPDLTEYGTVMKADLWSKSGAQGTGTFTINRSQISNCVKQSGEATTPIGALFNFAYPSDLNPCFGNDDRKLPWKYKGMNTKLNTSGVNFDNAPGGFRIDLDELNSKFKEVVSDLGNTLTVDFPPNYQQCFVPTWSALAMSTPMTNENLFADFRIVDQYPKQFTPFDRVKISSKNLRHVELSQELIDFVYDELDLLPSTLPTVLTETYNYGKPGKEQIHDVMVTSTGRLNINNVGATGLVFSNPESPAQQTTFTAKIELCSSTITVESGGEFNIGDLNAAQHGQVNAGSKSTIHIKAGGTLRVTSEQSMLLIQSGATLVLDQDARIQLDNPESKIRIEGTLVINGKIRFIGEGYFEFATGNQLVINSSNQKFELEGINQRFVRIDDFASLDVPSGRHLEWKRGIIEYGDGAALNFTGNSDGVFLLVDFMAKYNAGAFGIHAPKGMGNLRLMYCNFIHLSFPIIIDGGEGITYMIETVFTRYDQGTSFSHRQYLDFNICDWSGYGEDENGNDGDGVAHYGLRSYYNGNTRLRDCSIYGHKNKEIDITSVNTDILHSNGYAAIEVEGGYLLKIVGGELTENDFGIVNKEFQDGTGLPTNIFLTNQVSINHGHAGIVMKGNAEIGLVMMDCAKIEYVDYCIVGEDIRLAIDPVLLDGGRINSFLINDDNTGDVFKFIKICYLSYTPPSIILARYNSWDWASQAGTIHNVPVPFPQYIETNKVGAHGNCIKPIAIVRVECIPTASRKEYCVAVGKSTNDQGFVVDNPTGINITNTVKVGFQNGVNQLREENFTEAKYQFKETANIDSEVPNTEDWPQTKTYLHAAISLSVATEGNFKQSGENRSVKNDFGSDVIRPNPTDGLTRIVLPIDRKSATVRVWDTFGKLMQELEITESANIDVTAWKSGFYVVEIVGDAKNRALRYKMLVTHL
jgi:hypothetical protein